MRSYPVHRKGNAIFLETQAGMSIRLVMGLVHRKAFLGDQPLDLHWIYGLRHCPTEETSCAHEDAIVVGFSSPDFSLSAAGELSIGEDRYRAVAQGSRGAFFSLDQELLWLVRQANDMEANQAEWIVEMRSSLPSEHLDRALFACVFWAAHRL